MHRQDIQGLVDLVSSAKTIVEINNAKIYDGVNIEAYTVGTELPAALRYQMTKLLDRNYEPGYVPKTKSEY